LKNSTLAPLIAEPELMEAIMADKITHGDVESKNAMLSQSSFVGSRT